MMNNEYPTIISFYTNTWQYKQYADKMKRSCDTLKLSHHIKEKHDTGNWLQNTRLKPKFILDSLKELKKPVLWVDVDGSILKKPDLLKNCDVDFAARKMDHNKPRIWHVGTMFFNYTQECLGFIDVWLDEIYNTKGSDELCLDRIWKNENNNFNIKTLDLPYEYFEMLTNVNQVPSQATVICHRASLCPNKLDMKRRKVI